MRGIKLFLALISLCTFQSICADSVITSKNCMKHLGAGGHGDFDCCESHAVRLEGDNRRIENKIIESSGLSDADRSKLRRFIKALGEAAESCGLAVDLSYSWKIDAPPKNASKFI